MPGDEFIAHVVERIGEKTCFRSVRDARRAAIQKFEREAAAASGFDLDPFFDQLKLEDENMGYQPLRQLAGIPRRPPPSTPSPLVVTTVASPVPPVTHRSDEGSLPMDNHGQPGGSQRRSPTPSKIQPYRGVKPYEAGDLWAQFKSREKEGLTLVEIFLSVIVILVLMCLS